MRLQEIYETYRKHANFFVVYIREAHPSEEGPRGGVDIPQARTFDERQEAATECQAGLELSIPILIDGIDNVVGNAYAGWPDRLYIVGTDGRIAYRGDRGPWGFDPDKMERALRETLGEKR